MTAVPPWLPNAISVLRVLLVPAWLVVAELHRAELPGEASWRAVCLGILLLLGFSDVLDGYLARRFSLQTPFGATLDAVADKLAQVAIFTYLALRGAPAFDPVPLWFLGVLILRDAINTTGNLVIRAKQGVVDTSHAGHGKLASLLLFALLVWVLWGGALHWLAHAYVLIAALVTLSTALYVADGAKQLGDS